MGLFSLAVHAPRPTTWTMTYCRSINWILEVRENDRRVCHRSALKKRWWMELKSEVRHTSKFMTSATGQTLFYVPFFLVSWRSIHAKWQSDYKTNCQFYGCGRYLLDPTEKSTNWKNFNDKDSWVHPIGLHFASSSLHFDARLETHYLTRSNERIQNDFISQRNEE